MKGVRHMGANEIIKAYIEDNGIRQSFVAKKIGMPPELLRRSLEGKRRLQADEFIAICEVLSLDLDFFKRSKLYANHVYSIHP